MREENYTINFDELFKRIAINTKEVLSCDEAALYLDLSTSQIYKLTSHRLIPYSKPNGKTMYFRRKDLENWAMSNTIASEQQLDDMAMTMTNKMRCRK